MNLRDLTYIIAVAEHGHFGRAAEACFVSQPTLSVQVQKLEEELGVKIFERNNKQLRITAMGEQIIAQAKQALEQIANIKQLASSAQNPLSGKLALGLIPSICPYLLRRVFPDLKQALPEIQWQFYENQTENLLKKLSEGELDMLIMAVVAEIPDNLEVMPFFEEELLLALPANHPWAGEKVSWEKLNKEQFLLLDEGHCLRDQVQTFCLQKIESTHLALQSIETLWVLVAQGQGVSIIPGLATHCFKRELVEGDEVIFQCLQEPVPRRTLALVTRKTECRTVLRTRLHRLLKKSLSSTSP